VEPTAATPIDLSITGSPHTVDDPAIFADFAPIGMMADWAGITSVSASPIEIAPLEYLLFWLKRRDYSATITGIEGDIGAKSTNRTSLLIIHRLNNMPKTRKNWHKNTPYPY
jgi:hypothetical protein